MKRIKRRQPTELQRAVVIRRDEGCLARRLDLDSGFCRRLVDNGIVSARDDRYLELDHINEEPGGELPTNEAHLVALCQWHHRGGWWRSSTMKNRVRRYLAGKYPVEWAEWLERRA